MSFDNDLHFSNTICIGFGGYNLSSISIFFNSLFSLKRYKEIIFKSSKDGADYILYVVKKKEDIKRFAEYLPRSNKLMFIDINSLIHNIKTTGKINPIFQEQLLLYDEV